MSRLFYPSSDCPCVVQDLPEKLVRDRIPEIIRENGHEPVVRIASDEELDLLIREKIVEESRELLTSGSLEEIADVLEAVLGLLNHRSVSWTELEVLRSKKKEERGGFEKGFVLITTNPES